MSNGHDTPRDDAPLNGEPPRYDGERRHDEPRIDDGSATEQSRTADEPRYGERITPTSAPDGDAPTRAYDRPAHDDAAGAGYGAGAGAGAGYGAGSAPAYGESADRSADATPTQAHDRQAESQWPDQQPAAQYGQQWNGQHDAQQQHHGAAAAAPVYGQPNGGGWQSHDAAPVRKKKTVGVVAFIIALVALALGVVAGLIIGAGVGGNAAFRDAALNSGGSVDQQQLQREVMKDPNFIRSIGGASFMILGGTVLGLWALIQGIVAAVTARGRAFGVLAIILAVVGPIALGIVASVAITAHI